MNFPDILGLIEKFQNAVEVPWYRGCSKASYKLLPSIARHSPKKDFAEIYPIEKEMESLFSQRSRPFLQGRLNEVSALLSRYDVLNRNTNDAGSHRARIAILLQELGSWLTREDASLASSVGAAAREYIRNLRDRGVYMSASELAMA